MRGNPSQHEVQSPGKLAAALAILAKEPGVWTPLGGGTDLMVVYEAGLLTAKKLLNLYHLRELRGIQATATHLEIGAMMTFTSLQRHDVVRALFPSLIQAAAETGGIAIQSRGTIGGNIANASPAADSPPALLALDAELELVSAAGVRRVPYHGFHLGYKKTVMRPDELIRAVLLPLPPAGRVQYYRKVGTRKAQAISKVVLAASASRGPGGEVLAPRLALGSVAPTTVRCLGAEAAVAGQVPTAAVIAAAVAALAGDIAPIDDIRSTRAFRLAVAGNVVRSFLAGLA